MLLECLHFEREKEKFGQQISLSMITQFSSIIWTKKNKFLYFQTVHTNFLHILHYSILYLWKAGLEICSSVFQVNRSFFVSERAKEQFAQKK